MCMRAQAIKRTKTGAYIIGGVYHKVHPKILRVQQRFAERAARIGETRALSLAKKEG